MTIEIYQLSRIIRSPERHEKQVKQIKSISPYQEHNDDDQRGWPMWQVRETTEYRLHARRYVRNNITTNTNDLCYRNPNWCRINKEPRYT